MKKIILFMKKEAVLDAALFLAFLSLFFVKPDREYLNYIDYRTIGLLFSLMSVMAGLQKLGVFYAVGRDLLRRVRGRTAVGAVLVYLCFFSSMLITNDVALITFVPFGITVLKMAETEELTAPVVILQTVAANLGSMLTPIGNPQNLYLYSRAGVSAWEFLLLMLPYTVVSFLLLTFCLTVLGRRGVKEREEKERSAEWTEENHPVPAGPVIRYILLFLLAAASVARVLPWQVCATAVAAVLFVTDRDVFRFVDYSLLLTFAAFFIFIGNMGRIPAFASFLNEIIGGHETATAVAASQIISNVPTALLLSGFTDKYQALIVGTNLGGLGTMIASMASLISYKYIARQYPEKKRSYLIWFTAVNGGFLAVLMACTRFF
ncbi:MAG: SLC13 family permease [Enterocloster sp.]